MSQQPEDGDRTHYNESPQQSYYQPQSYEQFPQREAQHHYQEEPQITQFEPIEEETSMVETAYTIPPIHPEFAPRGQNETASEYFGKFFTLHWIQAVPAIIVGTVIVATTIHRLINAYNDNSTPAAPTPTPTPVDTKPVCLDIEDIAGMPTTCHDDCSACDCPFPLKRHNCELSPDGSKVLYGPIPIDVPQEDGKSTWICTCGQSKLFPLCDGSHRQYNQEHGTNLGPYQLNKTTSDKKTVYVCGCGHSRSRKEGKPFCDGTHQKVKLLSIDDDKKSTTCESLEDSPTQ